MQAQIQAEEAQRLREQADAEAAARQQAEDVIIDVGADEAAKLKAARAREAALAGAGSRPAGRRRKAIAPQRKANADAATGQSKSSTKPCEEKT